MYTIDADQVTIRDLMTLQKSGSDLEAILPILQKCVVTDDGRPVADLPATHLRKLITALVKRLSTDDTLGN